jgi:hypothetical protein
MVTDNSAAPVLAKDSTQRLSARKSESATVKRGTAKSAWAAA